MSFILKLKSNKWFWVGLVLVILVVGFFLFGRKGDVATSAVVKRQSVIRTVSVTGKTKAKQYADIAFEQSGQIATVGGQVGDVVRAGQTIVVLDQQTVNAKVGASLANLSYQEARLRDAEVNRQDAENNLRDKLLNAHTVSDDSVRNHIDKFFHDAASISPTFGVSFSNGGNTVTFDGNIDTNLKVRLSEERSKVGKILAEWQAKSNGAATATDLVGEVVVVKSYLATIKMLADDVSVGVNAFATVDYQYRTTLDSYKADLSTARTNINTALSNIIAAEQSWNAARLAVTSADGVGDSTQAAQIKQAAAEVALDRATLAKYIIKAPFNGLITKQEGRVGETAEAGKVMVSIIAPGAFEIEANVPEVDIGQVMVGQAVTITIDAFADETFTGKVTYVEPAETIIDGVVNYKIKVAFDKADERLKNGLTANVAIITLDKSDVLTLPSYFVIEKASTTAVRKVVGKDAVETVVVVGVKGGNGLIEIVSGLNEGDQILAP